jgi:hypothetical protein
MTGTAITGKNPDHVWVEIEKFLLLHTTGLLGECFGRLGYWLISASPQSLMGDLYLFSGTVVIV